MSSAMDGIATKDRRPNLHFPIVNPKTGIKYNPNPANGWRFQKSTVEQLINVPYQIVVSPMTLRASGAVFLILCLAFNPSNSE